jgi:L-alanine-DL-glutamate epimerase-like enolase superfamily enzyme
MDRIASVEVHLVEVPLGRTYYTSNRPIERASQIMVKVTTEGGVIGWGESHGSPLRQVAAIIHDELAPLVIGENPLEPERLWQKLFDRTTARRGSKAEFSGASLPKGAGKPQTMAAIAGIDIALWDIAGKTYGTPVWRLLGGYRDRIPTYVTGGYYPEEGAPDPLEEEFATLVAGGWKAVKLKAGGVSPAEDAERARRVRETIGDDIELYIDASQGFSVREAIEVGRAYEDLGVVWFEEPVHWYDDITGLGMVSDALRIPITSGESEYTKYGVRDLVARGRISICNYDVTKSGGLTDGRKIAALLETYHVELSPHHAAHVQACLAAAIPNGKSVEMHADRDRDPLWFDLFSDKPRFEDGDLVLDDTPGLGFDVDEEALAKLGERFGG